MSNFSWFLHWSKTLVVLIAIQLLSCVQLFSTPSTVAHQAPLSSTVKIWVCSNSCPLSWWRCYLTISSSVTPFSFCLQSFPSIRIFGNESALRITQPKHWSFSNCPSNEKSRLISFRIDWFDSFAVQGILRSLFQDYSSKVSSLQHSAFFTDQLAHPYMTTRKNTALYGPLSAKWCFCLIHHLVLS